MNENKTEIIVIDCAVNLHKELGPGLLETLYEVLLAHELESQGLKVDFKFLFRLTNMKLGYLLNCGEALLNDGISRLLNGYITE